MIKGQRQHGRTKRQKRREREVLENNAEDTLLEFEWKFYQELFLTNENSIEYQIDDIFSRFNNEWKRLCELYNKRKTKKQKMLNPLAFYEANINQKIKKNDSVTNFGNPVLNHVCWII